MHVPTGAPQELDYSGAASTLLEALPHGLGDPTRLRLGRTMVLWRVKEHEALELLRNLAVEARAVKLQTAGRRRLAVRTRTVAANARAACQRAIASRDAAELEVAIEMASALPVSYAWARSAQAMMSRLALEARVKETLEQLVGRNAEASFERLSACIDEATELGDDFLNFHAALLDRAREQVRAVAQRHEARALLKQIIDGDSLRKGLQMAASLALFDGSDATSAPVESDVESIMMAQARGGV